MNKPEALVSIFDNWLDEASRKLLLSEAQIVDDRPSLLRGEGGTYDEAYHWMQRHRAEIAPLVLRYVDPPDRLIEGLARDGDLLVPHPMEGSPIVLSFSRLAEFERQLATTPGQIPVFDLALTSAFVSELFIEMAHATRIVGVSISPPQAKVSAGSVEFALDGGLLASGLVLLVACSEGLVGAPVAGATLATAGLIDLVLSWRKQVVEIREREANIRKLDAERRLAELEIKIKELELEKAQLLREIEPEYDPQRGVLRLLTRRRDDNSEATLAPDSAEVPRHIVRETAADLGIGEVYANHLLNRTLFKVRLLKQKLAGTTISSRHVMPNLTPSSEAL